MVPKIYRDLSALGKFQKAAFHPSNFIGGGGVKVLCYQYCTSPLRVNEKVVILSFCLSSEFLLTRRWFNFGAEEKRFTYRRCKKLACQKLYSVNSAIKVFVC